MFYCNEDKEVLIGTHLLYVGIWVSIQGNIELVLMYEKCVHESSNINVNSIHILGKIVPVVELRIMCAAEEEVGI